MKQSRLFKINKMCMYNIYIILIYRVLFDLLSRFCHSGNVGCANLMTCMGSLTLIAKFRVSFIEKVLAALETLSSKTYELLLNKFIIILEI